MSANAGIPPHYDLIGSRGRGSIGTEIMETVSKIMFVAAGGAFGAAARYLLNISPLANTFERFPLPTFTINVVGSFGIGFLAVLFANNAGISEQVRLAVVVGFLGAFTTFSAFEFELYGLFKDGFPLTAVLYLLLSVSVGFVALIAGVRLASQI